MGASIIQSVTIMTAIRLHVPMGWTTSLLILIYVCCCQFKSADASPGDYYGDWQQSPHEYQYQEGPWSGERHWNGHRGRRMGGHRGHGRRHDSRERGGAFWRDENGPPPEWGRHPPPRRGRRPGPDDWSDEERPPPGWEDRHRPPPPGWDVRHRPPPPGWEDRHRPPPPREWEDRHRPPPPGWEDRHRPPPPEWEDRHRATKDPQDGDGNEQWNFQSPPYGNDDGKSSPAPSGPYPTDNSHPAKTTEGSSTTPKTPAPPSPNRIISPTPPPDFGNTLITGKNPPPLLNSDKPNPTEEQEYSQLIDVRIGE